MDREQMRMAILNQEQIFRQQVHELHRLYHVQKQLMQQAQITAPASRVPVAVIDVKPRPQQLDIWCREKATSSPQQQIISFTSCSKATITPPACALAVECNLELTLATGPSSSSSNSSCDAERQQRKRFKASSNCDSGSTVASSRSTDSKMAQFQEVDVAKPVRFHGEVCRKMDEMGKGPWMYQCLSLKMATSLHQDMDREQMRMAILNQEQIFRQQVHELHRLYHVQKQLMQQAQITAPASGVPVAVIDVKPRPQQLDIWCPEKATSSPQQQIISFTSCSKATITPPASALAVECNLELTLATGPSSSSSNSSCDAERQQRKRFKASSNCDSGSTVASSTSTDSDMAQFQEVDVAKPVRFHGEVCRKMDEMGKGPWMYQCLSLKMA